MSFFIKNKPNGVRRAKVSNDNVKKRKLKKSKNEEITSSEDEGEEDNKFEEFSSEDEHETAQEKKLRLAKVYLQEIEKEEKARLEQEEIDENVISKRLKEDYLKESGKLRLAVADQYKGVEESIQILKCREQSNCITCTCISSDDKHLYVGSKDGNVVKYCLSANKKVGIIKHVSNNEDKSHRKKVLSIAISTDNKFLAIGDESSNIHIWDPVNLKFIKNLTGHKNAISGVCFKKDSHTLYSCSKDRTAKVWNLDDMAYVESLFGHQSAIVSIDTLYKDRVATSGGHDLRIWKIPEETQLIFNGHVGNIDNVRMINEMNFISGGDDGEICLWSVMRKKPVCIIKDGHGINMANQQPNWISALTALPNTDLFASGSHDGFVKLWKLDNSFRKISFLLAIPVTGFVNSLNFTSDGAKLIVSVSREHKFGRWDTIKSIKNHIVIFSFIKD